MDVLNILYSAWFLCLLMFIMAGGITYLVIRGLQIDRHNEKKLISTCLCLSTLLLIIFYFFLPIPQSVHSQYISYVHNMKNNNELSNLTNIKFALNKYCNSSYLNGYQYFELLDAYHKDAEITFDRQKFLSFKMPEGKPGYKEKHICELKLLN